MRKYKKKQLIFSFFNKKHYSFYQRQKRETIIQKSYYIFAELNFCMKKLYHIIFWIFLIIFRFIANVELASPLASIITSIIFCCCYACIAYTSALVLRKFNFKRYKLTLMILNLFIILSLGCFCFYGLDHLMCFIKIPPFTEIGPAPIFIDLFRSLIAVCGGILYQYFFNLFNMERKQEKLMLEKTKIELQYLKNQINPHFLFNTLNNLYGLTFNKDDRAPRILLRLSDILRYTTYESSKNYVPLKKEIKFLEDYVQLESLRFSQQTQIIFNKEIPEDCNYEISPMLLLPFIENAFKHGDFHSNPSAILEVNIWIEQDTLLFSCTNTFDINNTKTIPGIGIDNTLKRLQITYGDRFRLEKNTEENHYYILLTIPLDFSNYETY